MNQNVAIQPLRQSASIILTFSDTGLDAHRILMLNRKPHMSFAKALVFPGGVCEPTDSKYLQDDRFQQFAKITAIRQLFQQTKIVLLPPTLHQYKINALKAQFIELGQSKFTDQLSKIWSSNLKYLIPLARFVTPQFPKMRRYDCIFYMLQEGVIRINFGQNQSLEHLNIQQEQSSKYFWKQPQQFLNIYNQKTYFLAPPQNIILNCLMRVGKQNMLTYSKLIDSQLITQPFLGIITHKRQFLIVGDQEYDSQQKIKKQPASKSSEQIKTTIAKLSQTTKKGSKRRIVPKPSNLIKGNIMYDYNGCCPQLTILRYLQPFHPPSSL